MRSFNRDIYNRNLRDLRSLDKTVFKNTFYSWVMDVANGFPTDQVRVGIVDRNDIIQECFLAFENAWNNLDWDAIHAAQEQEQPAIIWGYLKKSIKLKVRNRLTYIKDGIRTYSVDGNRLGNSVDDFLSILFDSFYEDAISVWEEPVSLYDIERLANGLDEAMRIYLSDNDRRTIEYFYGIDCDKQSLKQIANIFNTNQNNITVRKKRAIAKLNREEVKQIIRKNF